MSEEPAVSDDETLCQAWLRRLGEGLLKLEPLFPIATFLPDEGLPHWAQHVERELSAVLFPVAKLKNELDFTPRRMPVCQLRAVIYGSAAAR